MSEQTRMTAATIVVGAMLGAVIFFAYAQASPVRHGLVVKKTAATVAQQLQPTQPTDHFQRTTNPQ